MTSQPTEPQIDAEPAPASDPDREAMRSKASVCALVSLLLVIFTPMLFFAEVDWWIVFGVLVPLQLVLGLLALVWGRKAQSDSRYAGGVAAGVAALELAVVGLLPFLAGAGGA